MHQRDGRYVRKTLVYYMKGTEESKLWCRNRARYCRETRHYQMDQQRSHGRHDEHNPLGMMKVNIAFMVQNMVDARLHFLSSLFFTKFTPFLSQSALNKCSKGTRGIAIWNHLICHPRLVLSSVRPPLLFQTRDW
jgi:hypothetical protein